MTTSPDAVADPSRRLAAVGALVLLAAAPIVGAVFVLGNLLALLTTIVGLSIAVAFAWLALTHRGTKRVVSIVVAAVAFIAVVVGFVTALAIRDALIDLVIVAALIVASALLAQYAVGSDVGRIRGGEVSLRPAGPAERAVLLMNPKSGGGKVEKFDVVEECRKRGVEPIVLHPDDDWRQKTIDAVEAGATVLGAAGGDGTQALVATVAVEHGLPFVCIPAGTRNHFALDLGVDRDDVVGSLDAFVDGVEQRVDLGIVADRVFVNNVSLGVYGEIVQSDDYRDAKVRTAVDMLPDLLGPDGDAPELRLVGPDGAPRSTRQLVLISNNPYELRSLGGFGTRERMDTGLLGITTISVGSTAEAAQLTALGLAGQLDRFSGYDTWTASEVEVDGRRAGRHRHRRRVRAVGPTGAVLDPARRAPRAARPSRAGRVARGHGGARGPRHASPRSGRWPAVRRVRRRRVDAAVGCAAPGCAGQVKAAATAAPVAAEFRYGSGAWARWPLSTMTSSTRSPKRSRSDTAAALSPTARTLTHRSIDPGHRPCPSTGGGSRCSKIIGDASGEPIVTSVCTGSVGARGTAPCTTARCRANGRRSRGSPVRAAARPGPASARAGPGSSP